MFGLLIIVFVLKAEKDFDLTICYGLCHCPNTFLQLTETQIFTTNEINKFKKKDKYK